MKVDDTHPDLQLHLHLPLTPEQQKGWHLYVCPAWQRTFDNIAEVCAMLLDPVQVIQNNNRGLVVLVQYNDIVFVAKRALTQETRWWKQFTSLYRDGEGARTLKNMAKLYELGLPVPEPVLVLEKKRFGFVVASWSFYRYLEGQLCTCTHSDRVAEMLRILHQKGWVHRDPHVKNFLLHREEVRILDCARARPWKSTYARMYDVVLLNNCCPGSLTYYGISEAYWIYRLAKFQNRIIQRWRRIKRKVRSFVRRHR